MRKVGFIYDDVYLQHTAPAGHPERQERLVSIVKVLKSSALWETLVKIKPRKAEPAELEAVHTREHVERMQKFRSGYADPDTYVSEGSLEAALYAAGGVMEAIDRCKKGEIERAFCAIRPPGHHAEANRAMGFCLFNNVAVGARHAQRIGYGKVFIVDFDVHHGNGTQHIFEEDDTVFYFSTHQYPHYPGTGSGEEKGRGRGQGFTVNFPMPPGAGDKEYSEVYQKVLPGIVKNFAPDILMVSAGYDIHSSDPLAYIRVTTDGIVNIVKGVLSSAQETPAVFCLEGGYSLEALAESVLATIETLVEY